MDSIIIEIRPAEGGEHSRRLAKVQAEIYKNYCLNNNLAFEIVSDRL